MTKTYVIARARDCRISFGLNSMLEDRAAGKVWIWTDNWLARL